MNFVCKKAAISMAVLFSWTAYAEAPVSEIGADGAVTASNGIILNGNNGAIVPSGSIEDRVALLERTINARLRLQADLQQQVDALQGEVSELRGQLEQQNYQLEQSQERQRQLYLELDKVNQKLTAASPAPSAAAAPADGKAQEPADQANYSANQDENQAYDAAVNVVLKEKNYDKAIPAFQSFIKKFPSSEYVPNAYYWLGQLMFSKGDKAGSMAQYKTLVAQFEKSPKRADALYKLGILSQQEGKKAQAKAYFEQVQKEYPNTTSAQQAKQAMVK